MRRHARSASIVCLLALISPADAQSQPPMTALEPIVQLAKNAVAACGLKAIFVGDANVSKVLEVVLERNSSNPFVAVRVEGAAEEAKLRVLRPKQIAAFRLQRSLGTVVLSAPANDPDATEFIRQTMTFGIDVEVSTSSAAEILKVQGPVPPSIRAAYLNCAGDLYRPGE